jgi:hypothetical protein
LTAAATSHAAAEGRQLCSDEDVTLRTTVLVMGVATFAFFFAINSAVNSGLIAKYRLRNASISRLVKPRRGLRIHPYVLRSQPGQPMAK